MINDPSLKPLINSTTLLMRFTNQGYSIASRWDDPPSNVNPGPMSLGSEELWGISCLVYSNVFLA